MTSLWKKRLTRFAALLVTGAVIIPVGAYLVGSVVVGPYEGENGLAGYLGTIYLAALGGERAALILILSPWLIVIVWKVGLQFVRRGRAVA